ncbi:hypothetical protein GCM10007932_05160 [Vibrio penaeicida]|uniref:Uncharacterized protein n=1 Tax=Vibrio penaeicida TaxID=104609 RepID=A0AAV5NKI4_9VIBR|nr:hypothetical protein GCM10007932_05160 [Vibrio penaeicida]
MVWVGLTAIIDSAVEFVTEQTNKLFGALFVRLTVSPEFQFYVDFQTINFAQNRDYRQKFVHKDEF